ncbi:condensin complex subunit 1 [Cinnamomum micranthum f. kanehirae]|uniref:Condensin-1 complex subunit CAP-D2 n=1 Tax=Cinnamomum micranthum f. kanehirae TaxID=337451 RepID=A0A3S3MY00_9MAGN|nr:condensin complex subunit 1 [Cinnamomum micranthum f. kanehirae]
MAPPFIFPSKLHDLESEDADDDIHLTVQSPISISSSFTPSALDEFTKGVVFDLSDKELFCIEDQDVFDRVYSLIRDFPSLPTSCKFNLVESLRSNLSVLLPNIDSLSRGAPSPCSDAGAFTDRVASHRNAFKIYTFFLVAVFRSEESNHSATNNTKAASQTRKKYAANSWNWESQRSRIVSLIANSLEINLMLLFGSSDPDENYLSFITKFAFSMFENPVLLKDADAKDALCRIIGTCATKYHYSAQSCASILHLIHKFDYVSVHLADAVVWAEKKYMDSSLAISLIREIGRTNPKDYVRDTVGAENIGRFLVELADRLPKLMSTNIGILLPHFGGESYKIRNALVGVLGKLVAKAFKDVDGDVSAKSIRLRSKQAMLEILRERCRDVSAYTRSRVLQVWAELCEEHAVSIGLWNEVATVASGRLEDKSAIVRKSALNLLIMMLQHNPFGPQLRVASFEVTLETYKEKLREMEPAVPSESVLEGIPSENDISVADSDVDQAEAEVDHQDSVTDSCLPNMENAAPNDSSSMPDFGNSEQTRALIASLEAGLRFSKCLSSVMPTLVQLLASSSATDVENTILLLMRCRQFQIDGSEACLRKMLPLVFSQDKSIYAAVEDAFITIYIRKNPAETAANLLNLAVESNIGDLAALEFIIGSLVSKGDISTNTITALWDFFSFNVSGVTAEQSRGALSVLCMAAKLSPGIIGSHLQDVIDIGFGRWAKQDPLLARTACVALQRLSEGEKEKLMSSSSSKVFGMLQNLITGFWLPDNIWYAAADKAISAIYSIHPTPETLATDVVKRSLSSIFDCNGEKEVLNPLDSQDTNFPSTLQVSKLSRFLFIISHVALNQLVYIESCVRKIQKQKLKKDRVNCGSNDVQGDCTTTEASVKDGITAELGLAASEDAILDTLSERAEKEIVSGSSVEKNVIGCCAPFLLKLCRNFSLMQKFPELQASGMLALCRLMIIDADFCEANLQLLFTVVESAPTEVVRSNCTIALGDLAVRYPNLLEPWTENVYARLRDPSISVRKNAVLVLSHLILNDMMKVKGYINEMAMRLEDEDERISSLAKLFFHELSKKGSNPIYNLLPDILGRLSNQNLKEEAFHNIMHFLIGSIKKDKQMEALVEKLCNRFCGVTERKQWEYIAYCLSQLTFTEKGIKKLMELFKTYEHVLSLDSVMDHFRGIINKGKKFAKPELKSCIEEFEEKLNKFHMERKEQEQTAINAQVHHKKVTSAGVEGFMVAKEGSGEEDAKEDISEDGSSEVINPSSADKLALSVESNESLSASSAVSEPEPRSNSRDFSKSKSKKSTRTITKGQKDGVSSTRSVTRSSR